MNKSLVCFFSASGNTKRVAEKISSAISADVFEMVPVNKYTDKDLDWNDEKSRSSLENNDRSIRPKITKKVDNIDKYDTIILGYPIWWGKAPNIVDTFINENDLSNKKIYVFVTSGGSGAQSSFDDLSRRYSNLNFVSTRRFDGNETHEEYQNWLI